MIHPTAILDSSRGDILSHVSVEVGAYCVLVGPLSIDEGTRIWPHCVIGSPPEHRNGEPDWVAPVTIGRDCVIREHVAIQRGIDSDPTQTAIGNRCYLMHGCHVGHNSVIDDDVTMSPLVVLGGHSRIHRAVTMGIQSSTHQRTTVGAYAMIGMGVALNRDVPPGLTMVPERPHASGRNQVGFARHAVTPEMLEAARVRFLAESTRPKVATPW